MSYQFHIRKYFDGHAFDFLDQAGIEDSLIRNAIVNLTKNLKYTGLWDRILASYPMVGGSATAHKFNLKNSDDSDSAYRITFAGGWTHSSTGAAPNGTTGYGDTHLVPSSDMTQNDTHLSYYGQTTVSSSTDGDIGSLVGNNRYVMYLSYANTFYSDCYHKTTSRIQTSNSDSTGFHISSRTDSSTFKAFKNGTQLGSTQTGAPNNISSVNYSIYIGAVNNQGSIIVPSEVECSYASIGSGLTDNQASKYNDIINSFQTKLSRNV